MGAGKKREELETSVATQETELVKKTKARDALFDTLQDACWDKTKELKEKKFKDACTGMGRKKALVDLLLADKTPKEHFAFLVTGDVAKYNINYAKAKKEIDTLTEAIKKARGKIRTLNSEIGDLNRQVVNTEAAIDSMNTILKDSGFQGFSLRAKEGVQNVYEVVRRGDDGKDHVVEDLSEGERNFIAFLYYFHLVKGSHSSDEVKDKIVVIDDPFSSMDSSVLYIVGSLVREMIDVCYNNTDYKGNLELGDYIKHPGGGFNLDGKIKATNFVQKKAEEHTKPDLVAKPVMKLPTAENFGLTVAKGERLSQIIAEINSRTGKAYDNDVVVKAMLQIMDSLMKSEKLKTSAKNNTVKDLSSLILMTPMML